MKKSDVLFFINKFEKVYLRLKDAVDRAKDILYRDGVIQRFEFKTDLFWKTLRISLAYNGEECRSPRDCVKKAYKNGMLRDDEIVLDIIEDGNKSSHVYDEQAVDEIFQGIREIYIGYLGEVSETLRQNI